MFSAWDFLITERETADNKLASLTTGIKVGVRYNNSHRCYFLTKRAKGSQFLIEISSVLVVLLKHTLLFNLKFFVVLILLTDIPSDASFFSSLALSS